MVYNKFYQSTRNIKNYKVTIAYFQSFLIQYEGVKDFKGKVNKVKQLLINIEIEDYNNFTNYFNQYLIEFGKVDSI